MKVISQILSITILVIFVSISFVAADNHLIQWDKNRPLTWDDFKGEPNASSPHDAETTAIISCQWEGEETRDGVKITSLKAIAYFDTSASWVKDGKKSDDLLKHEQGHFDLAEGTIRKNQKDVDKLVGQTFSSAEEAEKKIAEICDKMKKELDETNEQYDNQTDHGKDPKKQDQWNKKIEKMLK